MNTTHSHARCSHKRSQSSKSNFNFALDPRKIKEIADKFNYQLTKNAFNALNSRIFHLEKQNEELDIDLNRLVFDVLKRGCGRGNILNKKEIDCILTEIEDECLKCEEPSKIEELEFNDEDTIDNSDVNSIEVEIDIQESISSDKNENCDRSSSTEMYMAEVVEIDPIEDSSCNIEKYRSNCVEIVQLTQSNVNENKQDLNLQRKHQEEQIAELKDENERLKKIIQIILNKQADLV